jgi:hypothetical protein
MSLTELHDANALLRDPSGLAARHQQEGCLLVRGAIDPGALADLAGQAAALLERWGVARLRRILDWVVAVASTSPVASRRHSRCFRSAGYEPTSYYNGNPYARYWFAKRLPADC